MAKITSNIFLSLFFSWQLFNYETKERKERERRKAGRNE